MKKQSIYTIVYLFLLALGIFMSSCSSPSAERYAREQAEKQLDNVQENDLNILNIYRSDDDYLTVYHIEVDSVEYIISRVYSGTAMVKHEPKNN